MSHLEYKTTIRNGDIVITDELRQALLAQGEGQTIRIIIPAKNLLREAKEKGYDDFLEYLIDHPIHTSDPVPMTREELHERKSQKTSLVDVAREQGYDSLISYLRDHPLQVDDPKPLTRDEIYDRSNF